MDLGKYRRRKSVVYLSTFSMDLALGLFLIMATLQVDALATQTGTDRSAAAGLLGLSFLLMRLFLHFIAGHISDFLGRKALLLAAVGMQAAAFLFVPFSREPWHLLPGYLLAGLAASVYWPVMEGWMSEDVEGADLMHAAGAFNIAFSSGLAMGPLVKVMANHAGLGATMMIGILVCAITAALLMARPHIKPALVRNHVHEEGFDAHPLFNPVFIYLAFLANMAAWTVVGTQRFLFPALARGVGISERNTALLVGIFYGGMPLIFVFLKYWHGWQYKLWTLLFWHILGIVGLLGIYATASTAGLGVWMLLLGVYVGGCYFASMFYALDGVDAKGRRGGMHETVLTIGMLAGLGLSTYVAHRIGFRAPFPMLAAIVLLAGLAEVAIFLRYAKKTVPAAPASRSV